ncbi:response regulator transcription factor [Dyadobacter sp. 676]|uniref:Response regulator transcription factor n=1 Tax=Dyadobacter sp. 676 TaxID=3088362 RepID=A0AAU8FJ02_9BACT
MKKVLIIEDHPVVRTGTEMYLQTLIPDVDIQSTSHFAQAQTMIASQTFELITLDINIPGGDKLEIIASVRQKQPHAKILVFSGYDEELYAVKSIKLGADGFLSKHSSAEECKNAFNTVINGGKYISSKVQQLMLDRLVEHSKAAHHGAADLTAKEVKIAKMLVDGHTVKEIGGELNLAPSTVSTYKARIFDKMNVRNLVELLKKMKKVGDHL